MRGLQKSKTVSWASDLNLCQVKLFLSDESPSQVGLGGQDHLQAKASWPSVGAGSDDNLPPGFEGVQPANILQNKLSQIPLIQWKCPSRFVLDPNWQVVAGEESKEVEAESQREMRVLEAVYPRPSAIPLNPASPMATDESYHNDLHTPLIPITPIEDEDMAPDTSSIPANTTPTTIASHSSNGMPPGVEPDVVTAAYSALNSAMSNTTQGNLIDPNLLIQILSNPTLIEKLVSTHGPSLLPPSPAMSPPEPPPVHTRSTHLPSSSSHYPLTPVPVPVPNLPPPPPPSETTSAKKDINYYKSLIQQHGGDKPETTNNPKTRDPKQKIMKPCIYFNSSRGCRHGASCIYQHDSLAQQRVSSLPEVQGAKRMKMEREISGT